MWYFAWILGTGLACALAVVNAVWFELRERDPKDKHHTVST